MRQHEVLVAGGGPAGLMLAAELAIAGVDVAIIERRADQELVGSRALGMYTRTMEVLEQRGVADRFVSEGTAHPAVHFHVPLDIRDLPSRFNFTLGLLQRHTERILAGWVDELGVRWYRGREVIGVTQHDDSVAVELLGGERMTARYVVGCDGGRSAIRKSAGIDFPGWEPTISWLIGEAKFHEEPPLGFRTDSAGTHAIGKTEDGRAMRMVLVELDTSATSDPTADDLRAAFVRVFGADHGMHDVAWVSRFTDLTRQAAAYRVRRVLLAGDAAHVHPPIGGHGLNLSVQDAVNLGWKLALVLKRHADDTLLDTYHAERHPVGARVLRNTMAHVAIRRVDDRSKALGDYVTEFLRNEEIRRRMAAEMTALDIRYDFGEGHALLGRRMPDLDIETPSGTQRVFQHLHRAKHVVLNLDETIELDASPWGTRVLEVRARYDGTWELPAVGHVSPPRAVLIRPDGHVAWVSEGSADGLHEALVRWCGTPNAA